MLKITEYFIDRPRITHMIVVLVFMAGLFSTMTLQREQSPDVSFDMYTISTFYPGASPEDVEINVTDKIEEQLLEVSNIKRLTSVSSENLSIITITLDSESTNIEKTKNELRDAVSRVTGLPDEVTEKPVLKEITATDFPVREMAIYGDADYKTLRNVARDLESRLKEIPGIGRINMSGFRDPEVHIKADVTRLRAMQISLNDIERAIASRNVRATGGTIESFVSEKKIVTLSEYSNINELKNVVLRGNYMGFTTELSQVAEVEQTFEEPRGIYRAFGKRAIHIGINKQTNADIIDVSDELETVLTEFKQSLPQNVKLENLIDYAIYPRTMISIARNNGLAGFILVLAVMFIFLDRRSAFWSAFGIPFSIMAAIIFFQPFGINLNNLTLSILILLLGIVVDDAIVITEKVFSLRREGMPGREAALEGVRQMIKPVSAAIATTILAFAPIWFIPGIMGNFLGSIPLIVTLVLLMSLIEAIWFIPAHIHSGKTVAHKKEAKWFVAFKKFYQRTLVWGLKHRWYTLASFFMALILVFGASGSFLKFLMNQDLNPDFFTVVIELKQGSKLQYTSKKTVVIEKLIEEMVDPNELQSYKTEVGSHNTNPLLSASGDNSHWAMVTVFLRPAAERNTRSETYMERIDQKLITIKENDKDFTRLETVPFGGLDTGSAVEWVLISQNDKLREKFNNKLIAKLKTIEGARNIESTALKGKEELHLKLNYHRLATAGLTAADVAMSLRTAFEGRIVTSVRQNGEDINFRVMVKNPAQYRDHNVLNLPVANYENRLVPMSFFARLEPGDGPAAIYHDRGQRSVTITADVDTEVITSAEINQMLDDTIGKEINSTHGIRYRKGGQALEMAESMTGFGFAFITVIVSIYFILVVIFNSYRQPLLIMSIIPFAIAGVLLTLLLHNLPVTFVSLIGMLGLIGVVVNDTIIMISHLNSKTVQNKVNITRIAVAAKDRFRPVILTTLTTFFGLLPTSYGIGGDIPDIRPMVLTLAWGLVFSTVVTLGFIPVVYSIFKGKKQNETKTA